MASAQWGGRHSGLAIKLNTNSNQAPWKEKKSCHFFHVHLQLNMLIHIYKSFSVFKRQIRPTKWKRVWKEKMSLYTKMCCQYANNQEYHVNNMVKIYKNIKYTFQSSLHKLKMYSWFWVSVIQRAMKKKQNYMKPTRRVSQNKKSNQMKTKEGAKRRKQGSAFFLY